MEKIVLLYKGREVILEEDKVCSAAAVWSLVERRKTKERSEIPSCKTNGVNQRKVPKTVVIDGAFCYFLCSAKQNEGRNETTKINLKVDCCTGTLCYDFAYEIQAVKNV